MPAFIVFYLYNGNPYVGHTLIEQVEQAGFLIQASGKKPWAFV
jgi:hypothetical protein